jgi:putative endonuclease
MAGHLHRFTFYTYILENLQRPGARYIGHTTELRQRLTGHSAGKCPHTAKLRSWKLKFYCAFKSLALAQTFERYLKSGSGHAFANKHFWAPLRLFARIVPRFQ